MKTAVRSISTFLAFVALGLFLAGFVGCSTATTTTATPAAPTPPQITVANSVNALAQAILGTVDATIAARNAGKVSAADATAIEQYCGMVANVGKQVDLELRSADTWAAQKVKILQIVAGASLVELKARISPGAQLLVVSLVTLANQISSAVGGPTL